MHGNERTKVYVQNLKVIGMEMRQRGLEYAGIAEVWLRDVQAQQVALFGKEFMYLQTSGTINLSNVSISNSTLYNQNQYFIYAQNTGVEGKVIMNSLSVSNVNLNKANLVKLDSVPNFELKSSQFSSISLLEDSYLIILGSLRGINLSNLNFTNLNSNNLDEEGRLLVLDSIVLDSNFSLSMNNITISNSSLSFMHLERVTNVSTISKTFLISNFTFKDSYFKNSKDLISFRKLEGVANFTIAFKNMTFSNITFETTGNLFLFQHQTVNPIEMKNVVFKNLTNAHINLEAINKVNSLFPVRVNMENITTSEINTGFNSFINLLQNTLLTVNNSLIEYVYSFDEGSVLSVSQPMSQAVFNNTKIKFNSAWTAGVFKVENQGVIKVYNCKITYNFAIYSGVIKAENNALFEFYNTELSNNMAIVAPISEMFEILVDPILSN